MQRARRILTVVALATLIVLGLLRGWSMLAAGDGSGNLDLSSVGPLLLLGLGGLCAFSLAALIMWVARSSGRAPRDHSPDLADDEPVLQPPTPPVPPASRRKWQGHGQPRSAVFGRRVKP